jgi:flagellar basal body-associated protein FliL
MARRSDREYFTAFAAITVLAFLLTGFYFAWISIKSQNPVAYASFKSIVISNQDYSIKTSISVQVASENKSWLAKNQAPLENVLKNALSNIDPKVATGPDGLVKMQALLKDAGNSAFHTNMIENVYFTDFLLSPTSGQ